MPSPYSCTDCPSLSLLCSTPPLCVPLLPTNARSFYHSLLKNILSLAQIIMAPKSYAACSVVGCLHPHKSLHRLPTDQATRSTWINFIFDGNVPDVITKKQLNVCAHHFTTADFSNLFQYNMGFANNLSLERGAVPSIRTSTVSICCNAY